MTREDALKHQEELETHGYKLGWWYGVRCEKCCGVYPKLTIGIGTEDLCRYECEVCGKRTKPYRMPWEAEEAWNNHEYEAGVLYQLSLF